MLNFDACELMEELHPGKYAYDMVWVDEWQDDFVCVSSRPRGSEMICCGNGRHVFHQVFVGQGCELQGFRITRCRHQCCIYARSNR